MWTVTLSAVVDGSGVFTFSEDSVTYTHRHWEPPKHVLFNGKPWKNLRISPKEWTLQRGKLDLSFAARQDWAGFAQFEWSTTWKEEDGSFSK